MKKTKLWVVCIISICVLLSACSSKDDFSKWKKDEVLAKVQETYENLCSKEALHTVETISMTDTLAGSGTAKGERWYADGNCYYVNEQSDGFTVCSLQYGEEQFFKNLGHDYWKKSQTYNDYAPIGGCRDGASAFLGDNVSSWEIVNGEYCVKLEGFPEKAIENRTYQAAYTIWYFSKDWELLRIENHEEYSVENEMFGSTVDIATDIVTEYLDTQAEDVKEKIEKVYKEVMENLQAE